MMPVPNLGTVFAFSHTMGAESVEGTLTVSADLTSYTGPAADVYDFLVDIQTAGTNQLWANSGRFSQLFAGAHQAAWDALPSEMQAFLSS